MHFLKMSKILGQNIHGGFGDGTQGSSENDVISLCKPASVLSIFEFFGNSTNQTNKTNQSNWSSIKCTFWFRQMTNSSFKQTLVG